jgi:uncharacterized protein GlcG (DUF336 family)
MDETHTTTAGVPVKPAITLDMARRAVAGAEAAAAGRDLRVAIAVVDDGGHLVHFSRMDDIHAATADVAIAKARACAMFRKPTAVFAEGLQAGNQALMAIPHMMPLPGGVPLMVGKAMAGAIGVSGAAPVVDAEIAGIGAAILGDRRILGD